MRGERVLTRETEHPEQAPEAKQITGVSLMALAKALLRSGLSKILTPSAAAVPAENFRNLRREIAMIILSCEKLK